MLVLLLEALAALCLLLFIVWWTMFSGRRKGELPSEALQENPAGEARKSPDEGAPH